MAKEMLEDLQKALVNINHPTFAPTEILKIPLQFIKDDAPTIDSPTIKDYSTNPAIPIDLVLQPELDKTQASPESNLKPFPLMEVPPIVNPLINRVGDDNKPPFNQPTDFNLVPRTVADLTPRASEVTNLPEIPDTLVAKNYWTTRRIVRWIFYFFAPIIGLLIPLLISRFTRDVVGIGLTAISFHLIGLLLGYIFPEGKWKWGWLLNLSIISIFVVVTIRNSFDNPARILVPFILTATVTAASYLGGWIKEKTHPSLETKLQQPATLVTKNEWTTARIVRWVFYFIAPIIGLLMIFVSDKVTESVFKQTIFLYGWSILSFLLVDTLIFFLFIFIIFGVIGILLGYSFPKEKWRWGLWLNLINIIAIWKIRNYFRMFGFSLNNNFYQDPLSYFLLASIIQNAFLLIFSCLASYLGSWLALRKAENKV